MSARTTRVRYEAIVTDLEVLAALVFLVDNYAVVKIVKTANTIITSTEYRTRAFTHSAIRRFSRLEATKTIEEDTPALDRNDSLYTTTYLD